MADPAYKCAIVGISGASASGKSLIAKTLYHELRTQVGDHNIGVITEDCYYRDQHDMPMEERVKVNYDHPNSMDHDLLFHHLQLLKGGKDIDLPQYVLSIHVSERPFFFSLKK